MIQNIFEEPFISVAFLVIMDSKYIMRFWHVGVVVKVSRPARAYEFPSRIFFKIEIKSFGSRFLI